jgi:hypothetical protein
MKGDFTRSTFRPKKHYSGVRMQQGRVQLDSDWNEQVDIATDRVESETGDVVGRYGVPMENPGFEIKISRDSILSIGKGHLYLDGILVENDNDVDITDQSEFLPGYTLPKTKGSYIAYLDVWQRHVTALEDDLIREAALGGPDTATRTQTVWQVRLLGPLGPLMAPLTCSSELKEWRKIVEFVPGKLRARIHPGTTPATLCEAPAEAGYRRLENQLYRVEIHNAGARGTATFKWSRDNGSIVTPWNGQDGNNLIVGSLGHDQVLGFAAGQTVELTDDDRELRGEPGVLVKLSNAEGQVLTLDPSAPNVDRSTFGRNPKVRRWDSTLEVQTSGNWIPLEDGVEVCFEAGCDYKAGDFWMIPARTAKSGVEWPEDETDPKKPAAVPRQGIVHHYCRLATLHYDGTNFKVTGDCRKIFPPITELTSLFYVSGDGQEAMPGGELPQPLQVGVSNGQWPVIGAKVRFKIVKDNGMGGQLKIGNTATRVAIVETDASGIASCAWILENETLSQRVEASLLDTGGAQMHSSIFFNANLSVASQVYYDPQACPNLKNVRTVKEAIDLLCQIGRGKGCAIPVGVGGQYATLAEAFVALKEQKDIFLCLLPGDHEVTADSNVSGKNSLKIVGSGAGSRIHQASPQFTLSANQILLYDLELNVDNNVGGTLLVGNQIEAEGCRFIRTVGSENIAPLILVKPLSQTADMYWKDNLMSSYYIERILQKAVNFLVPKALLKDIPDAVREQLAQLSEINPYLEKENFDTRFQLVVKDISTLKRDILAKWAENPPKPSMINSLLSEQKDTINNFYQVLKEVKTSISARMNVSEALANVFRSFFISYSTAALGLVQGVGGWIEDSMINGFLHLHYSEKYTVLNWGETDEKQQMNKNAFASANRGKYIVEDPVTLTLRGNKFLAVYSNGYSIMRSMEDILGDKTWKNLPEKGYRHITVLENIFNFDKNSFVSRSIIMSGNKFEKISGNNTVEAFVLADDGIFVGNIAPPCAKTQDIRIEKILPQDRAETAANLINIR